MLADRLRHAVESDLEILSIIPEPYTISLGVTKKKPVESIDKTLIRADDLLYKAKNNGRNQVQFATND